MECFFGRDGFIDFWMDGWNVFFWQGWIHRFLDGWMECFFWQGLIHRFLDGRMECFFPTAQGMVWVDANGNESPAAAQAAGMQPSFSLLRPVSLLQVRIGILHTLVVKGGKENERLKAELLEEIKKRTVFARRAQEKATPAKANVETKAAPKPMSMPAGPKAPAKAPANAPAFPKSKPMPKAPAPAGPKPMPMPEAKAKAKAMNMYHNVDWLVSHSTVHIEDITDQLPANEVALPTPKRQQQYKAAEAALKRMKRGG